jgi:hypothetical protein
VGDDADVEMSIYHSHNKPPFYSGITTIIFYMLLGFALRDLRF